MKFTEYVVLDRAAQAIDPLGFRRPAGALQDLLFPQFTVLTLRPAYLGALCCFLKILDEGEHGDTTGFARRFRVLEIFWGIANAKAGAPVINITKYRELCEGDIQLSAIPKRHAIYQRLSYGTLGHYTSAAIRWGLVDKHGKRLEPHGVALADGFSSRRSSVPLRDALTRWARAESFSPEEMEAFGRNFGITAPASSRERQTWKQVIREWCAKNPRTAPLWDAPIQIGDISAKDAGHADYVAFFQLLRDTYPGLKNEIDALWNFERLSAASLFIFELRVAAMEFGGGFENATPPDPHALAANIIALASAYMTAPVFQDARALFRTLADCRPDYHALTRCIVEHHIEHQRAKGTSPIIDHDELIVTGRVDAETMRQTLSDTQNAHDMKDCLDRIQFRYRRQWHFDKCRHWYDWAEDQTEAQQ